MSIIHFGSTYEMPSSLIDRTCFIELRFEHKEKYKIKFDNAQILVSILNDLYLSKLQIYK